MHAILLYFQNLENFQKVKILKIIASKIARKKKKSVFEILCEYDTVEIYTDSIRTIYKVEKLKLRQLYNQGTSHEVLKRMTI
jgi:hypothetical protein